MADILYQLQTIRETDRWNKVGFLASLTTKGIMEFGRIRHWPVRFFHWLWVDVFKKFSSSFFFVTLFSKFKDNQLDDGINDVIDHYLKGKFNDHEIEVLKETIKHYVAP